MSRMGSLRYSVGEQPATFRKTRAKYAESEKPQLSDTSEIVARGSSSMRFAAFTRCIIR